MTEKNLIDFLLSGPTFDDDLVEAINDRSNEIEFIVGIEHVQIAMPLNAEPVCRDFYVEVLGLAEIRRPRGSGGHSFLSVRVGERRIHFLSDPDFKPARYARLGFYVLNAEAFAAHLTAAGCEVMRGDADGVGRFGTRDPFGNCLEFIQSER